MNDSTVETRTTRIWLGDDEIIRIVTKPGITKQTLSDAMENMDAVEKVRQGRKRPLYVDMRHGQSS